MTPMTIIPVICIIYSEWTDEGRKETIPSSNIDQMCYLPTLCRGGRGWLDERHMLRCPHSCLLGISFSQAECGDAKGQNSGDAHFTWSGPGRSEVARASNRAIFQGQGEFWASGAAIQWSPNSPG